MKDLLLLIKGIGGLLAIVVAVLIGCSSCTDSWVSECERGGAYKEHRFQLTSVYTDYRGAYTEECRNCGLQYKWNNAWSCTTEKGSVHLYKNPKTGKFDTFYVVSIEDGVEIHKKVYRKDIKGYKD